MNITQKGIIFLLALSLFSASLVSALSPRGYIDCYRSSENSITLNYDFRGGSNVSLFRGNTRINTWGPTDTVDTDDIRRDIENLRRKIDNIAREIEEILKGEDAVATFPGIPSGFRFMRELGYGTSGVDVRYMQIIFNADPQTRVAVAGVGSPGQESFMFGNMTKNAVRRFQQKYASEILYPWNIQAPTGYAGMQTIKKLNRILEGDVQIIRIPPRDSAHLISELQKIRDEINDLKRRIDNLDGGSSISKGTFTDTNLSSNTNYTYYLRDGRTSTSPQIDSITCRTNIGQDPDPDPDPNNDVVGYINCSLNDENSIRLTYGFSNGSNVSLFRGSTRINSWVSSSSSGSFTDVNLSANTSYRYYLRNGISSTSPQIDTIFCYTSGSTEPPPPPPTASGTLSCTTLGQNDIQLNYSVTNATNASLFRGSYLRMIDIGSGTRSNTVRATNLSANTSYTFYLRNGTSTSSTLLSSATCMTEGGPQPFSCGNTFTDDRDNIGYRTVRIGNQCWFAEDLRHNNGCLTTDTSYANLRGGYNCIRQTSLYNAILYQWRAAMNGSTQERAQGLCPEGWHIPSDNDWKILETNLGMTHVSANDTEWRLSGSVGQKLKTSAWGGNNSSGFSALPGGHYNRVGESLNPGNYGYWWTSTATSSTGAYHRTLRRSDASVGRFASHYNGASSIRCIQN